MPFLLVMRDGQFLQEFALKEAKVTIGRRGDPGPDRLLLEDTTISSNHAVLERHGNQYMVQDLHSRNGILLNEKALPPGRLYPIQPNDCIQICDFTLELKDGDPSGAQAPPGEPRYAEGLPSTLGVFALQKVYSPRDVVGGDFFAAQQLDENRLALAVGDATGGGDPVVEVTLRSTEEVRKLVRGDIPPLDAAKALLSALAGIRPGKPVSFLYGILDAGAGTFRYVNAGHPTPVVFNRGTPSQVRKLLASGGPLVGGGADSLSGLEEAQVPFQAGDTMVVFTDGVLNASPAGNHDAEMKWKNDVRQTLMASWSLGLEPFLEALKKKIAQAEGGMGPFGIGGVARAVATHGGGGVRKLVPAIEDALREYLAGGDPGDDITVIGFERTR